LSNKIAEGTAEMTHRKKRRDRAAVQDETALSAREKLEADYN
jgi:cobalamin-dependent methionine synthase I